MSSIVKKSMGLQFDSRLFFPISDMTKDVMVFDVDVSNVNIIDLWVNSSHDLFRNGL